MWANKGSITANTVSIVSFIHLYFLGSAVFKVGGLVVGESLVTLNVEISIRSCLRNSVSLLFLISILAQQIRIIKID